MLDDQGESPVRAADDRHPGGASGFFVLALVLALIAALFLLRERSEAGFFATSPVEKAERLAPSKNLQVGLSYGARLNGMDEVELARSLDTAVDLGVRWVRTDLLWGLIERSPGVYDWSAFDRIVEAARVRDLEVLPILMGVPEWARASRCVEKWTCPPADVGRLAEFAGLAAARYSPWGVDTWQIWNEPNIEMFWARPNARLYAQVLEQTARSIRAADPGATIVFGGLAALAAYTTRVIEARDFLRRVCDLGACDVMDVFSYHPYTYPDLPTEPKVPDAPWSRIADTDDSFVRILDEHGLRDVPIWITEFGAPTGGVGMASDGSIPRDGDVVDHVTERRQGEIAFDSVVGAVLTPRVKMLVWYTDVDLPEAEGKQKYYGLFRADGTPKPAWRQLKKAVRRFAS
jgi:hypothetical protein